MNAVARRYENDSVVVMAPSSVTSDGSIYWSNSSFNGGFQQFEYDPEYGVARLQWRENATSKFHYVECRDYRPYGICSVEVDGVRHDAVDFSGDPEMFLREQVA